MSLLKPSNHSSQTTYKTNIRINYPSQKLASLVVDHSEISVFSDGIYITQQSGRWLPVFFRSELRQFLPLKYISSFTWGVVPNKPLIIFFISVFVVLGGFIGYSSQSCYYCDRIPNLIIGVIVGFIVGIVILSVLSKRFRHFEFVIQCDDNKFGFYRVSSSMQSQIIHIVEILRSLKYHELTLQTHPSVNQPNESNPPTQTGYPNAPKG